MSEYEKLKKHLSIEYEHDREVYTVKKVDFILIIIKEAKILLEINHIIDI